MLRRPRADASIIRRPARHHLILTTMGKQISVLRIKGSVGEVTGYRLNTSSKTSKSGDFIRAKAATVSNPRTYSQATQRAKARPAQLFYAAFANVLNHAFFPLGKAVKNRNRFLSLAMRLPYVPDVMKGEVKLPFAPYQVSEGTLGLDTLCVGDSTPSYDSGVVFANIGLARDFDRDATVGTFSSRLITDNPLLQEGMELTFLTVVANSNRPNERYAKHYSIVLNLSDQVTTLEDIFSGNEWLVWDDEAMALSIQSNPSLDYKILCAGLIISSKTASSWQYTNSYMALSGYAIDGFDWEEKDIIMSYMNAASSRESGKILQQADNTDFEEAVRVVSVGNAEFTLKQGVAGATSKTDCAVAAMSTGERRVVVSDGHLVWYNGERGMWEGINLTVDGVARPLTLADVTWDGSPTIPKAICVAQGFGR